MKNMKILILSCSTGGGHNSAGKAVKEQLEYEGHEAIMLDPFSLSGEQVPGLVGGTYINIASHLPRLFGLSIALVVLSVLPATSLLYTMLIFLQPST